MRPCVCVCVYDVEHCRPGKPAFSILAHMATGVMVTHTHTHTGALAHARLERVCAIERESHCHTDYPVNVAGLSEPMYGINTSGHVYTLCGWARTSGVAASAVWGDAGRAVRGRHVRSPARRGVFGQSQAMCVCTCVWCS